jgi:predicted O-linked N-acetylglucosamine transferase (SPINDLY family)
LIGVILFQTQKYEEAISFILKSLEINPNNFQALNNLGNAYTSINEINLGLIAYEQVLQLNPNFVEAAFNKANLLRKHNNSSEAIIYFNKAIKLRPNYFEAHLNKGNLLRDLKQINDAIQAYECALSSRPESPYAHYNLGLAMNMAGDHEKAIEQFKLAIQHKLDFIDAYSEISTTYLNIFNYESALAFINKAIGIDPSTVQLRINKGLILICLNRHHDAIEEYENITSLRPDMPEAWLNRANVLYELKRHEEAIASFERALQLKAGIDHALGDLVHTQMNICNWSDLEQRCMRLEQRLRAGDKASAPFPVLGLFDNPQLQKLSAQLYARDKLSGVSPLGAIPPRRPGGKIRVAYFSMDFREHPVSLLMADLIECHDRNAFEIYGFSFGINTNDAMRKRLEKAFDKFLDVKDASDLDIARLAREHAIDIAVDLGGHTKGSRPQIFAHRAAPVQINYLGYPGTMGTDHMDYFIADSITVEPQDCEHFSEKIIFLPNSFQANPSQRPSRSRHGSRAEFGLPQSGFVFCCFNNTYKITPDVFESWARILNQVQDSVLWLSQNHQSASANLLKAFESRQIPASRIVFAGRLPDMADHLARYQSVDLFLDTFPYGAHTTASDALWMGLPVLTRCGQSFASRVASSLLHAVGLPELVTHSAEAYESLAIELALNPQRLTDLKAKLDANRLTSPLFNTPMFTKHIESAYQAVHQRHLSGLEPEHIHVQH